MKNGRSLNPSFLTPSPAGVPSPRNARELLNAIFYGLRGGCAWRLLPHEFFLPWQSAYHYYFRAWRIDGSWGSGYTPPFAREAASLGGPRTYTEGRHHRLANGQDYRARRSSGLRRWQEDER
jgi:putative transposase